MKFCIGLKIKFEILIGLKKKLILLFISQIEGLCFNGWQTPGP
jgi:hypothetical protein